MNPTDQGYYTPESRSYQKWNDKNYSGEKFSPLRTRKRDSRSPSNERTRNYRQRDEDKEKFREYHRDQKDFSSFKNRSKNDFAGSKLSQVNWNTTQLVPVQKNFYTEHQNVKSRDPKEVEEFRKENRITIRSKWAPNPIFSFEEGQFPGYINEAFKTAGYKNPTPIQSQGWPCALSGNDVIGIAQTGSGKTMSFLLPAVIHIKAQTPLQYGDGPIVLILAPTRELAMQINGEAEKLTRHANVRSTCVYGGVEKYIQQKELQRGSHIVIACPGRLLDFLEMGVVNLRRVTYLVLDEADRMLDMGFEPQIRRIINQIRPDRQTLMWSATWPRDVQTLALEFCKENPIHVVIGNHDLAVNSCIKQNVEYIEEGMKESRLIKLLENISDGSKILIFCQTKRGCDILAETLKSERYNAISIHGDKTQTQRDYIMRQFKGGKCNILVATDLAARGLDVSDIYYVVNYDFPTQVEDYIHRVGRTGRAGRKGTSFTFFTRENGRHASQLIDILEETQQKVPWELYRMARRPIPINQAKTSDEDQKKPYENKSYENKPYEKPYDKKPFEPPKHNSDSTGTHYKSRFSYEPPKKDAPTSGFYYGNPRHSLDSNVSVSYNSYGTFPPSYTSHNPNNGYNQIANNYSQSSNGNGNATSNGSNNTNGTDTNTNSSTVNTQNQVPQYPNYSSNYSIPTPSTNASNTTPNQSSQPGSTEKQVTPNTSNAPQNNDNILKAFFSYNFNYQTLNSHPMLNPTVSAQTMQPGFNNSWYFLNQLGPNGQAPLPNYEKPAQPETKQ